MNDCNLKGHRIWQQRILKETAQDILYYSVNNIRTINKERSKLVKQSFNENCKIERAKPFRSNSENSHFNVNQESYDSGIYVKNDDMYCIKPSIRVYRGNQRKRK